MKESENILPQDGEAIYLEKFFDKDQSTKLFNALKSDIQWQQQEIKMFGKLIQMPRLTAWYGDAGVNYTYSGLKNEPNKWTKELNFIKNRIEEKLGYKFNSVLLNLYRDGNDSMGWHKDDEKELGQNPVICSISFGESRIFKFKHEKNKKLNFDLELKDGSILLMKGETQHHWYHSIPKTKKVVKPRINLTFRLIN